MPIFFFPLHAKDDICSKIETYLKGIHFISADFVQVIDSGEVYKGHFWLGKRADSGSKKPITKAKIEYRTDSLNQDIIINDTKVTTINNQTKKRQSNSISQTPIYQILTGNLDLSREKYDIIENSSDYLRIRISKSSAFGGVDITLIFSKYPTGNLKFLDSWIVHAGKSESLFCFDTEKLSINNEKDVPESIFALK